MELLLHTFLLIPVLGFLGSLLIPEAKENAISRWTFGLVGLNLLLLMVFVVLWVWQGAVNIDIKDWVLYQSTEYVFFIDFFFDHV